jgi:L-lactate dehydrogenase complex protein LldG
VSGELPTPAPTAAHAPETPSPDGRFASAPDPTSPVGRFAAALGANAGRCHGPFPADTAADVAAHLATERSGGRPVAVATGDALVTKLGLLARLEQAGAPLLLPDDDRWTAEIAAAGAGVTAAILGLAATGTVAVACGPRSPRSVSLLPPAHVCLLPETDLLTDLSEALASLAALPSALVWISGPSRSADLGMRITLGVHGPASLDVVVVAARSVQRAMP